LLIYVSELQSFFPASTPRCDTPSSLGQSMMAIRQRCTRPARPSERVVTTCRWTDVFNGLSGVTRQSRQRLVVKLSSAAHAAVNVDDADHGCTQQTRAKITFAPSQREASLLSPSEPQVQALRRFAPMGAAVARWRTRLAAPQASRHACQAAAARARRARRHQRLDEV